MALTGFQKNNIYQVASIVIILDFQIIFLNFKAFKCTEVYPSLCIQKIFYEFFLKQLDFCTVISSKVYL